MADIIYFENYSKSSFGESFWVRAAAGMFGGTVGGITLFLIMMSVGSRYGCLKLLDTIFNGAGYESCGAFGSVAGILAGTVIGVTWLGKVRINSKNLSTGIFAAASFLFPFLYAFFSMGAWKADADLLFVTPVICFFMAASAVTSVILLTIIKGYTSFIGKKNIPDQLQILAVHNIYWI